MSTAAPAVWGRRLAALGRHTVLAPLSRELLEPEEGRFDFALVGGLLDGARGHGLPPLWCGTYENASFALGPAWVERDLETEPATTNSPGSAA